jgi:hypothetical protein
LTIMLTTRLYGDVTITADGAYVPREAGEGGRTRRPSLYVAANPIAEAATLLDDLETLDARARAALVERSADAVVADFVAFHREELAPDTARTLLGDATTPPEVIARLDLVGLGVRPDAVVLDYSFGKDHTDELLVVAFDRAGQVIRVTHES